MKPTRVPRNQTDMRARRSAKILVGAFLCLAVIRNGAGAQNREDLASLFTQGNSEYQEGNFEAAEQHYRRILDAGVDSGPVYYNLGNACFKQKRLGYAIYYWEKALQKLPTDHEIQENIDLARLMIVDRLETPEEPPPIRFLKRVSTMLTITQESWLLLALFVVSNALFALYLLTKNPRRSYRALIGCLVVGFLFVLVGCSLSWKIYERDYRKEGIVVEQKVDVRSGPGDENVTVFTIHEGIKVRVLQSNNGWCQVSLPNGWNGWLQQEFIRVL
jgi:tetratricopeptide (TPR) repeat protein